MKYAGIVIGAVMLAGLVGCGSSSNSSGSSSADQTWPPTGQPVSTYSTGPDYQQRLNLLSHQSEVDTTLSQQHLDQDAYDNLLNVCMSTLKGDKLLSYAKQEFDTNSVSARVLLTLAQTDVC